MKNFLLLLGFLCTSTLFAQFTYNDGGLGGIQSPNTLATGVNSFSAGYQTLASGDYGATALGSSSEASGIASIAIGDQVTASGNYGATALGFQTIASGDNSTAMGFNTSAIGLRSIASGSGTTASGISSIAGGIGSTASGYASMALGYQTTADATVSYAIGDRVKADAYGTFAIGYNSTGVENASKEVFSYSNRAFVIGNGGIEGALGYSDPSDAVTILFDGTTTIAGNVTAPAFIGDGSQLTNTPQNIELYNPLSPSDSGIQ
ncbi:MAG: hypothetical protein ACPHXS_06645, partial [Flavobacteriaceae bacterium]